MGVPVPSPTKDIRNKIKSVTVKSSAKRMIDPPVSSGSVSIKAKTHGNTRLRT